MSEQTAGRRHQWKRNPGGEIDEYGFDGDEHHGPACEVCGDWVQTCCDTAAWHRIVAGTYEADEDDWCEGPWARAWRLPPEPPPDVTTVECDCHGLRWRLRYAPPVAAWESVADAPAPESALLPWLGLLAQHTTVREVTPERDAWLAGGGDGGE